ncbi:Lrp/AsnC ligand binding domain-containing protein [Devosia sp. UYZn731]|uniref:Lrp/AsnC ligand binding domain-containing protein n=1 Tax=Devosia sp. UYZn731 TaxID=3156345 RepID=UPI0033949343
MRKLQEEPEVLEAWHLTGDFDFALKIIAPRHGRRYQTRSAPVFGGRVDPQFQNARGDARNEIPRTHSCHLGRWVDREAMIAIQH